MTKFVKYEDILLLPTAGETIKNGEVVEEYIPKSQLETIPEAEVIPISFITKWMELHQDFISCRPIKYMVNDFLNFSEGENR